MTNLRPSLATGYTLVLPPGWVRLDARTGRRTEGLDRELDQVLAAVPRDSYGPLIDRARKQAHGVLDRARAAGALDLYLPLGGSHGIAVPASFLVTMLTFADPPPELLASPDGAAPDREATSAQIAAMLAARMPDGEVKAMPAGIAVRSRHVVPAQGGSPGPGTQVDYQWPLPSQPTKWALASFTTTGQGQPDDDIAELLIGLFDAIMLTWRWQPGVVI
jgi:hypothetical protein